MYKNKLPLKILNYLDKNPNITTPEIAEKLDAPKERVSRTLSKLEKDGRVTKENKPHPSHYSGINYYKSVCKHPIGFDEYGFISYEKFHPKEIITEFKFCPYCGIQL